MLPNNKNLLNMALSGACVICIVLAGYLFNHSRSIEFDFNEKKAALLKDNLDLRDRISSLEDALKQKTSSSAALEDQRKAVESELVSLKAEGEKIKQDYNKLNEDYVSLLGEKKKLADDLESLRRENSDLKNKIGEIEKSPLVEKIKTYIDNEQNGEVKKALELALQNIEAAQAGKSVNLAPVVVESKAKEGVKEQRAAEGVRRIGEVLSVDRNNNLVAIDLGDRDNVSEGDICSILKNDKELARGEVISVRYKISAVFINEVRYGRVIDDVKKGDSVIISSKSGFIN